MTETTKPKRKYRSRVSPRKINFSISMPALVKAKLVDISESQGRTVSSVLTEVAIQYIEEKEYEIEIRRQKTKNILQEIKNKL